MLMMVPIAAALAIARRQVRAETVCVAGALLWLVRVVIGAVVDGKRGARRGLFMGMYMAAVFSVALFAILFVLIGLEWLR
jgi:hypothetical protein